MGYVNLMCHFRLVCLYFARVRVQVDQCGLTVLHKAAHDGDIALVELLLRERCIYIYIIQVLNWVRTFIRC